MIILLGVPGSGKSTQGQILASKGRFRWISMGEILRNNLKPNQKSKMLKGELLNNQETIDILNLQLRKLKDGPEIILDGFPRNTDQATWLLEQNSKNNIKISALIHLFAPESVVEERLMSRGRVDDSPKIIANRFDIYQKTFQPIIKMFKNSGVNVIEANANQTPENILKDIVRQLKSIGIKA